ncbi:regulatory protein RecX [Parablautia muri]|uniref:Regulatory protein RecX n=1 Tax=Parablautia muri TaxID=2320879 RepID=A0A9X5BF15_9FIRM|nr:regulatory protein RecX [Parablautia muri]NBJ92836.1 regulatory protein RecX [Parablautia muri]
MTVTDIKQIDKSRLEIEIDDTFTFVLYKGEVRAYEIKQNQELDEESYQKIMKEVLPKRAKLRAMNLLKSRSYTAFQLEEKLKKGGYPDGIIKEALDYVISFGYIDDERYAADYIEYNKEIKSQNRIYMDLSVKGVSKEIIERMWEGIVGEDKKELEKKQIFQWMQKKHFAAQTADFKEKQKMVAFLYRKGFAAENIRNALSLDITII